MDTTFPKPAPASQRGFWALIITQFQGAFSDNTLKWLVLFLIAEMNLPNEERDKLIGIVGALFALPFILFSMSGGYLADRFSKRAVTIGVKAFEILVMMIALFGLATNHLYVTIGCVFLMGVHSAFFGPSKYGLLPELLEAKKLSWGNGVIELTTFLAIVMGTVAGGWLCKTFTGNQSSSGMVLIAFAVLGLITSFGITKVPAANPTRQFRANFVADLWSQVKSIRQDRVLWLAVLGNTFFFGIAALIQLLIVTYAADVLHLTDETKSSYLQAATAIGIGLGSFVAGYLSGGKIEYGLVPLGALGLTLFSALLGREGMTFQGAAIELSLLGFSGGLFIVPIAALLQHRPAREQMGGVLAAANLISFIGIFAASALYYLFTGILELSPPTIFLVIAAMTLGSTIYAVMLVPDSLMRFLLWMLTHTLYRVRVVGSGHIPEKGGALFVCNHLSFMDACFLIASSDRHIRFIMYKGIYDKWWVKPFAKMLNTIPITAEARPREMIKSLQTATQWIKDGHIVCIFAEGQITRIGQMLPFRRGMSRIMKGVEAPIVPVHLDNVWGSIFSFEKGRFYSKLPRRLPYPVTVSFGEPMPSTATPEAVRQVVMELGANAWPLRGKEIQPLGRALVRTARRHPFRLAMTDATTPGISFFTALTKSVFLARRLCHVWQGEEKVGLLLPPSVGGALVNHAALLLNKVPVNLNYTLAPEAIASCMRQCGIRKVVTTAKFLEKLNLDLPVEKVFLEDVAAKPALMEKLQSLLLSVICPAAWFSRCLGGDKNPRPDDLATIIFSSGSTGDPKGVMLTHANIISNVEQINQAVTFRPDDRLLGILPFFHSFGFTGTLAAPSLLGLGVAFHFNPTDSKVVGELVSHHAVSFLLATPTFLQIYMRGCQPEQFGSVRFAMVGAEKLQERLATPFEQQFGIRPLEAYGCTECSPAVAVNTMDFRAAGFHQVGSKRGSIGHPLPGMAVRIVDPETGALRQTGESGLMLLKGPNIMKGYLGRPEKTAEVLRDGWYSTGDIAAMDEDGFIFITDRLSRFSKIGGEMVPHIKVEERLHELAGVTIQTFAVTSLPDEKKGERLTVIHTLTEEALVQVIEKLSTTDLPNLWKPKRDQFLRVNTIPVLGTGKTDLRQVKTLASSLAENT
jgi:acyl-[acyl-carrier-protein]-phospholipid O-acyltransferase/long-chain-fatty-acid--[acyl-carrier-protein] ligase